LRAARASCPAPIAAAAVFPLATTTSDLRTRFPARHSGQADKNEGSNAMTTKSKTKAATKSAAKKVKAPRPRRPPKLSQRAQRLADAQAGKRLRLGSNSAPVHTSIGFSPEVPVVCLLPHSGSRNLGRRRVQNSRSVPYNRLQPSHFVRECPLSGSSSPGDSDEPTIDRKPLPGCSTIMR